MLNYFSRLVLFYFAYMLLFLMLALNNISDIKLLIVVSLLIVIIGFVLVSLLLFTVKSVVANEESIKINENKNYEYLGFLITYIIPFIITFQNIRQIVSFSLLLVLIGYLYIETSLFSVNPLLKLFFRYNIYDVSIGEEKYYLMTKKKLKQVKLSLEVKKIGDNILIE